jgi:hypothetical protein
VTRADRIRAAARVAAAQFAVAAAHFADAIADLAIDAIGDEEPANDAGSLPRKKMLRPQNEPTELDKAKGEKLLRRANFANVPSIAGRKRRGT